MGVNVGLEWHTTTVERWKLVLYSSRDNGVANHEIITSIYFLKRVSLAIRQGKTPQEVDRGV